MPRGAPVRPLPLGFFLCGMLSLFFSGAMGFTLLIIEIDGHGSALQRGLMVLLLSLEIITTEALWDGSPAAYPASVSLAASFVAAMVAGLVLHPYDWPMYLLVLAATALVLVPVLVYLRRRARHFWPSQGTRVPAPRP
jgi:hypothetical protein